MLGSEDRVGSPGTPFRGGTPGIDQSPAPGGPTRSSAVIGDELSKINPLTEADRWRAVWDELIAALKAERRVR